MRQHTRAKHVRTGATGLLLASVAGASTGRSGASPAWARCERRWPRHDHSDRASRGDLRRERLLRPQLRHSPDATNPSDEPTFTAAHGTPSRGAGDDRGHGSHRHPRVAHLSEARPLREAATFSGWPPPVIPLRLWRKLCRPAGGRPSFSGVVPSARGGEGGRRTTWRTCLTSTMSTVRRRGS